MNHRDLTAEMYRMRISSPGYAAALRTRLMLEHDLTQLRAGAKKKKKTKSGVDHEASAHHAVKTAYGLLKSVLEKMDHHEDYVDVDPTTGKPATGRHAPSAPRPRPTPVSDRIWANRRPSFFGSSRGYTRKEIREGRAA